MVFGREREVRVAAFCHRGRVFVEEVADDQSPRETSSLALFTPRARFISLSPLANPVLRGHRASRATHLSKEKESREGKERGAEGKVFRLE